MVDGGSDDEDDTAVVEKDNGNPIQNISIQ